MAKSKAKKDLELEKAEEKEAEETHAEEVKAAKAEAKKAGIETLDVEDPEELRPKELPLVVKPKKGGWKNKEQEEYAAVLNAYAYSNTRKWRLKKGKLLQNLVDLGENPELIEKLRGQVAGVSFKNQLIQTEED